MEIINASSEFRNKVNTFNNLKLPNNIIVFSHLRWDFVFQRPQHLLTRFASDFNIFFIEEPIFNAHEKAAYTMEKREENIQILVPHLPSGLSYDEIKQAQKSLFDQYMEDKQLSDYAFWYYTPMALEFSRKHTPDLMIYDCMDELSAFKFASLSLKALEAELLNRADIVFTGGRSLYEAKKEQHPNIHPFPSSIEAEHFNSARKERTKASHPVTLGFYGVIDERFDIQLIKKIAEARHEWQLMLIGPVVKIDDDILPRNENIHYLGPKSYNELPTHLATWDIALIPFLLNESTRFISPTKTPEYLSAGLPVISTPIHDVVDPYGKLKLVHICKNADEFIKAAEKELNTTDEAKKAWLNQTDIFLSQNSWDKTYSMMLKLIKKTLTDKSYTSIAQ